MIRYISTFIILSVLGILFERYKLKYMPDEELEKYDLIRKYLLNGSENIGGKPILWIHTTHNINARHWQSFASRNSTNLNQPYILSCIETIIKTCGETFNVCLIDDSSFLKLIPNWTVIVRKLSNPIRAHIRTLAMARLLYMYGGMQIPDSMITLKNLKPLYNKLTSSTDCFVGQTISRNITSTHVTVFPNTSIIGCKRGSKTMEQYIRYLELLNSRDYTNEIEFLGNMERQLYKYVHNGQMGIIRGDVFGSVDAYGKAVNIDRLLGKAFIDFTPNLHAIYLPSQEILDRVKYGWFARLSQKQLRECDTVAAKWLLIAQNQKI